ncbi:MAG TPA: TetR family transcriptional regulator [Pseudonocardiaceae bacterium]
MSRWDPDARGRLERAAIELFERQGFAETTVPQITERAGLTTRTFFRYFADKREVLFYGEDEVRSAFTEIIRGIPADLPPMALIRHALEEMAARIFGSRFDYLRSWRAIVASDEGLRERLLRKQELTTDTALAALRERGLDEPSADMIARLAAVVLQRALDEWLAQPTEQRPLVQFIHASLDRLRATVA